MSKEKSDKTGFSMRLSELMSRKKMTIQQASEIAGTGTSQIQSWKTGSLSTDYEGLQKLASALGVSFEFLLTGKSSSEVGIEEVIDRSEQVFDGYLKVKIERVIPRKK